MARTRRARRPRLTIVLAVLASITIITLDYRGDAHGAISSLKSGASDAFSPVQRGVDAVTRPIGSFLAGAVNGGELQQENNKLRYENGQLEQQVLAERATANALKSLDRLDHLTWTGNIGTVTAEVIADNSSNFSATVELDKGTKSGIGQGMPVVGSAGLVGMVISASSSTCTVRLITDTQSFVGVRYGPTSAQSAGVVGQGLEKPLSVSDVYPGSVLHKGEVLTTSSIPGATYPPLIPVARITRFSSTSTAVSVTAEPVADLAQLDYVDVLQWPAAP